MQKSICGHCGHDKFEPIVARPENSKVEVIFVQCSKPEARKTASV
jgi:hypothetical protein